MVWTDYAGSSDVSEDTGCADCSGEECRSPIVPISGVIPMKAMRQRPSGRRRRPAAASSGQQRPAAASSGQQRPAAASGGQRRPAADSGGQRRPAAAAGITGTFDSIGFLLDGQRWRGTLDCRPSGRRPAAAERKPLAGCNDYAGW